MRSVELGYKPPELKEDIGNGVLNHVCILPDNNRTWARNNRKTTREAYEIGAQKFITVADSALQTKGIEYLTIIVLTADNILKRPPQELEEIYGAVRSQVIEKGLPPLIEEKNIRFDVIGKPEMLPEDIADGFRELTERSEKNNGLQLSLVFGYDPDQEMQDAMDSAGKGAHWEEVKQHLYLQAQGIPPVSAIIRSGSEQRLSGIFPNSSAGAELVFNGDTPWPEYTADIFAQDVAKLEKRVRKGGA